MKEGIEEGIVKSTRNLCKLLYVTTWVPCYSVPGSWRLHLRWIPICAGGVRSPALAHQNHSKLPAGPVGPDANVRKRFRFRVISPPSYHHLHHQQVLHTIPRRRCINNINVAGRRLISYQAGELCRPTMLGDRTASVIDSQDGGRVADITTGQETLHICHRLRSPVIQQALDSLIATAELW